MTLVGILTLVVEKQDRRKVGKSGGIIFLLVEIVLTDLSKSGGPWPPSTLGSDSPVENSAAPALEFQSVVCI